VKVLFVISDQADNSTGRAHCLWLLARDLGWSTEVVATTGDAVWSPLRGTPFASEVQLLAPHRGRAQQELRRLATTADVVVAVKPLRPSFGLALAAVGGPLVVDIDDPDLEATLGHRTPIWRRAAKWVLKPRVMGRAARLHRRATRFPRFVSNPYLQELYGGVVLPHVRQVPPGVKAHRSDAPVVAFVGTNRAHKGLGVLREAVSQVADQGFSLVVTDAAPSDAKPWERWVGSTSMEEGLQLVQEADIVVIPSLDTSWAWGQLPVKLVDALMAGVPVIASRIDPIPWALGDGGLTVAPGDVDELRAALLGLRAPEARAAIGLAGRERAERMFSIHGNAEIFGDVVRAAQSKR
jgi:glycosyltransferase involved in cell wall biosynthesis